MKCGSATKHSLFIQKTSYQSAAVWGMVLLFLCGFPQLLRAQMFSVGDSGMRFNTPQSEFYGGLEPMDVNYRGGSDITPAQGARAFNFEGPIIRVGYESPGLDLSLGSGGSITGIDEASYFDIGGNIDFGLNLYRGRYLSLQLPLRVASRYTNITSNRSFMQPGVTRFRFGSLTAGAGARVVGRPAKDFRIEAGAVPSYGFSFASGGFFGGSLGTVDAYGRLYFDRLFGDFGISLGYQYDFRNYNVDEDVYDYRLTGHSLELGITF